MHALRAVRHWVVRIRFMPLLQKTAQYFTRIIGAGVAVAGICYALALSALEDYDRAMRGDKGVVTAGVAVMPKAAALAVTAQVLPLRQPGTFTVRPGQVFADCNGCPEMVEIPPGYYLMGTTFFETGRYGHLNARPRPRREKLRIANREGPRRMVHIPHSFAIMRFELTYAQWLAAQADPDWQKITGRRARIPKYGDITEPKDAVTGIDWYDARAYARWLSAKTGETYRIPSEAEWEYVARAGTTTAYPWGDEMGTDHAACQGTSTIWPEKRVGPGGMFPPNGFGVYDMIGNGWEWTADCYIGHHTDVQATGAAETGGACDYAVIKGGSALESPWQCRSGMRVDPHRYNGGEGSTIRLVRALGG